jgi:hypothetical protein
MAIDWEASLGGRAATGAKSDPEGGERLSGNVSL